MFIDPSGRVERALRTALKYNMPIKLVGPTSCGKTTAVRHVVCDIMNKDLVIINCNKDMNSEDLKGKYVWKDGKAVWQNSLLVNAMIKGEVVCFEEMNFLPGELQSEFHSVLDHRKDLVITEHEGETIKAHPDFRAVCTMNEGYGHTVSWNDAMRGRWKCVIKMDYLPAELESKLLVEKTGVSKENADTIVMVANKLRKSKDLDIPDIGTRTLEGWAEFINDGWAIREAAEHTLIGLCAYTNDEQFKVWTTIDFLLPKDGTKTIGGGVQQTTVNTAVASPQPSGITVARAADSRPDLISEIQKALEPIK